MQYFLLRRNIDTASRGRKPAFVGRADETLCQAKQSGRNRVVSDIRREKRM